MPGLLDIAPSTQTVTIGTTAVTVLGVSAKGFAVLLERFPDFRKVLTGMSVDLTADALVKMVPDAIAAIIAAGTGNPGDAKAEAVAESLPVGTQLEFIQAILAVTMPKGVAPFVESLTALGGIIGAESLSTPDMKSPQPSNT